MSAQSFLITAIENNSKPKLINIDKSGVINMLLAHIIKVPIQRLRFGNVNP
ncbi:MAG: hypothetical protein IMY67_02385 [Bacteroidetes bacterium]|nr:hypothetical protein [Bacteroidota bacterium]